MNQLPDVHLLPSLMVPRDALRTAPAQRARKPRSNFLTAVIRAARLHALDPDDSYSVWSEVVRMANQSPPPAPLLGHVSEGVQYAGSEYEDSGFPDLLTFKNLADRLRRLRSNT